MSFEVSNDTAHIKGEVKAKGAKYGKSAAQNHKSYLQSLANPLQPLNKDVFSKFNTGAMNYELQKLENERMTPVNFLLRYTPKKGFFAKLFTGKIDKQALLGYTAETMDGKTQKSVEEFDKELNKTFSDTGVKLTSKAFDVNNDGQIDIAEEAVSTVIADILSKDDSQGAINASSVKLKKADGSYTNNGENKMMAFCNEKNVEEAREVVNKIYSDLKLDKAKEKFEKNS